eukprot:m51a1_g3468 adenylate kinase, putative (184) ;mRNA; r:740773-741385
MATRPKPNVLVTGTPGTGKSALCELVGAATTDVEYVDTGKVVREKGLHSGYDAEFDTLILDEDRLLDDLEDRMEAGGVLLEYHSCGLFPERWFDLVVVLRADNTTLYDRLVRKGYQPNKIGENVECEIMQVVLDEAKDSYRAQIIWEVDNNNMDDLERNASAILDWVRGWPGTKDALKPPHAR